MDYSGHLLRTAPLLYFPLDDVVPGGVARQLGSLSAVNAIYTATARRTHRRRVAGGLQRQGAATGSASGDILGTAAFTVGGTGFSASWWQQPMTLGAGWPTMLVSGAGGVVLVVYSPYSDGLQYIQSDLNGTRQNIVGAPSGPLRLGRWDHYVVTFETAGGIARLYRNGSVIASQVWGTVTLPAGDMSMQVGALPNSTIQHVGFWNRPLLAGEARQLYRVFGS